MKYKPGFQGNYVFPIAIRTSCVNQRLRNTDQEVDGICGTNAEKKSGYLVVLINRATRQAYAKYAATKNDFKVLGVIRDIIKENNLVVDTITQDRGPEFNRLGLLGK